MLRQINGESIIYRHAEKADPDSDVPGFPGLSRPGVDAARRVGRGFLSEITSRPPGTVFVLSAHSSHARTRSTLKALSGGIREILDEERPRSICLIGNPGQGAQIGHATPFLRRDLDKAKLFPEDTCLVYFPRHLRGFDVSGWYNEDGSLADYYTRLTDLVGGDQDQFVREWIKNRGQLNHLRAPSPSESAKGQVTGIEELRKICTSRLPGRPIVLVGVGHSYNLDAYAVALHNGGQVTEQAYMGLGGRAIQEMEAVRVFRDDPNPTSPLMVSYGNRSPRPFL